jgi:hypothetical protein
LSNLARVRVVEASNQINGMNGVFERARRRLLRRAASDLRSTA